MKNYITFLGGLSVQSAIKDSNLFEGDNKLNKEHQLK